MGSRFWVSTSAAAAALLALPLTVVAQDANEAQDGDEAERLDAVIVTSTRREELLYSPQELKMVTRLRRVLADHNPLEAMSRLLSTMRRTDNNDDFLASLPGFDD